MIVTLLDIPTALLADFEGGKFCGVTTRNDGVHCAVVLLGAKPDKTLSWRQAVDWAESVGAELPSRPVAAMLFANAKAEFEEGWHWTSEEYDGSFAWLQGFGYGYQSGFHKGDKSHARAVRMIPLTRWTRRNRMTTDDEINKLADEALSLSAALKGVVGDGPGVWASDILRAADMLCALRDAALAAQKDAWQPIETAPKSGIFLGWDEHGPEVWEAETYWSAMSQVAPSHWPRNEARALTHWMPLPAPPVSQQSEVTR